MSVPSIIALCGNPDSGKTTVAGLLESQYGYEPVDDGAPLREIAVKYMGFQHHQAYTQEGKLEFVELDDKKFQCRQVLGETGSAFESKFGDNILGDIAYRTSIKSGLNQGRKFSLGSVRRDQGLFWKSKGGIVVEVLNENSRVSEFEFDKYNRDCIDFQIENDGKSMENLLKQIRNMIDVAKR